MPTVRLLAISSVAQVFWSTGVHNLTPHYHCQDSVEDLSLQPADCPVWSASGRSAAELLLEISAGDHSACVF